MNRPALRTKGRPSTSELPAELEISLSNSCSLACTYCHFGIDGPERRLRLTAERACRGLGRYIKATREAGVEIERIGFPDSPDPLSSYGVLKECVSHIRRMLGNGVTIEVQTNGLLLDAEKVRFLSGRGVRLVLRLDAGRVSNDRHRVFFGKGERSVFNEVLGRVKALPAGYAESIQVAPSFTTVTAAGIGRSVEALYRVGFREIQFKSLNLSDIWPESGLKALRSGLRELKSFCRPLVSPKFSGAGRLRLHLTSFKSNGGGFCELVLGCDGRFYPASFTPKAPAGLDLYIGDVKSGIDAGRLSVIKAEISAYLERHGHDGLLRYVPSYPALYQSIILRGLDVSEAIRSNGLKSILILKELGGLMRLDERLNSSAQICSRRGRNAAGGGRGAEQGEGWAVARRRQESPGTL